MERRWIMTFESHSEGEWREQVMQASGMLDILYDLKEAALEYLDVRHYLDNRFAEEGEPEGELVDKKIVYMVDLHDKDVLYLGNLCGGEYSYESPDIEENLYWNEEITATAEEIAKGFREGQLYLNITFCIVVGEDGDLRTVSDDTSKVLGRISDMHPEAEFETFNPWDLN